MLLAGRQKNEIEVTKIQNVRSEKLKNSILVLRQRNPNRKEEKTNE